jgi:outer membrane lipoprotein LolB
LILIVAGCASVPPVRTEQASAASDEPFTIDGRFSARRGSEAATLNFSWTHDAPRDEIVLTNPLGQEVAELSGDMSVPRAEVRTAEGHKEEGRDWNVLTERAMGFPLPVAGLAWWVRGFPRGDAPHEIETDAAGRTDVLRQNGCEIVYAYADETTRRPSRLRLACSDLEMRILIDRWHVS